VKTCAGSNPASSAIFNDLWPSGTGTRLLSGADKGVRLLNELRLVQLQSGRPYSVSIAIVSCRHYGD
jgi:hypothetical protein